MFLLLTQFSLSILLDKWSCTDQLSILVLVNLSAIMWVTVGFHIDNEPIAIWTHSYHYHIQQSTHQEWGFSHNILLLPKPNILLLELSFFS